MVISRMKRFNVFSWCTSMQQTRYTWFILSSLLGLLFILWGALTPSRPLLPGDDPWLVLPGFLMFFLGIFGSIETLLSSRSRDSPPTSEHPSAAVVSASSPSQASSLTSSVNKE
ncbi:MAG: hypothetical protein K9W42_01215 [Candidatus Heimdallarchaeota archaeon]|nr:hypothetical protein [Candidatus Heimdallarchaeota archaeon]